MGWPFSNPPIPPNVDSDFVTLTGSLANVPSFAAGVAWVMGIYVFNPAGNAQIAFELRDANNKLMLPDTLIAPGGYLLPPAWDFMPINAIPQWKGNGLVAKLWAYQ